MKYNEIKPWLEARLGEVILDPQQCQAERQLLLTSVLGLSTEDLLLSPETRYTDVARLTRLESLLFDRIQERRPVQQLLGEGWFYGLRFQVNEHTLIPRPETELLVEQTIALCKANGYQRVLDLGTGSGCIAVALKHHLPELDVSAVDLCPKALLVAKCNAEQHQAEVAFHQGNWFGPVVSQNFDIIVSNPPYIEREKRETLAPEVLHEPESALFSAWDPLMLYQFLLSGTRGRVLNPGGSVVFEVGEGQAEAVYKLMGESGFNAAVIPDYAGIGRVVWGTLR